MKSFFCSHARAHECKLHADGNSRIFLVPFWLLLECRSQLAVQPSVNVSQSHSCLGILQALKCKTKTESGMI